MSLRVACSADAAEGRNHEVPCARAGSLLQGLKGRQNWMAERKHGGVHVTGTGISGTRSSSRTHDTPRVSWPRRRPRPYAARSVEASLVDCAGARTAKGRRPRLRPGRRRVDEQPRPGDLAQPGAADFRQVLGRDARLCRAGGRFAEGHAGGILAGLRRREGVDLQDPQGRDLPRRQDAHARRRGGDAEAPFRSRREVRRARRRARHYGHEGGRRQRRPHPRRTPTPTCRCCSATITWSSSRTAAGCARRRHRHRALQGGGQRARRPPLRDQIRRPLERRCRLCRLRRDPRDERQHGAHVGAAVRPGAHRQPRRAEDGRAAEGRRRRGHRACAVEGALRLHHALQYGAVRQQRPADGAEALPSTARR